MVADTISNAISGFAFMVDIFVYAMSALGGVAIFTAIVKLGFHEDKSKVPLLFLMGGILIFLPKFSQSVVDTTFENNQYVESSQPQKERSSGFSSAYVEPVKPIKTQKEITVPTEKKVYTKVESVDYSPFLKSMGIAIISIIGVAFGSISINRLIKRRRLVKYKKIVARYIELPNDFMVLSKNIENLESDLNKINLLHKNSYGESKSSFANMISLLESKKQTFETIIKDFKNMEGVSYNV